MSRAGRAAFGAAALAAALGLSAWWWLGARAPGAGSAASSTAPPAPAAAAADADAASPSAVGGAPAAGPLAATSLRGSAADGEVRFAPDGSLVLDLALRRYFDYHLSLIGERDPAQIRALLRDSLSARFAPAQVERVLAHFDRYVAYLQAVSQAGIAALQHPAERLAAAQRLRREMLGEAMAAAFFAEEDARAAYALRRFEIARDPALNAEQKRAKLEALARESGDSARTAAMLPELAAEHDAGLVQSERSAAERRAEREALWGAGAAQRLAALDAQRADWDARVRAYLAARAKLDADPRLSPAARAQAVQALRGRWFDANEQRRIASLEAVGQVEAALEAR